MQVNRTWIPFDNSQWKTNPHLDPNHYIKPETNISEKQRNLDAIINDTASSAKKDGKITNESPKITRELPQFLETILDKKIKGVALNILDRFIDFIASFFDAYNARMADLSVRVSTFKKVNEKIDALLVQNKLRQNEIQEKY